MTVHSFFVPGRPIPKGSTKAFAIKRGGHYTGKTATVQNNHNSLYAWQARIAEAARAAGVELVPRPWGCTSTFMFRRPKSHYRTGKHANELKGSAPSFPTRRNCGDRDKLERAVLDGLQGVAWVDDAHVVDGDGVRKRWAADGDPEGVLICIWPIEGAVL